MQSSLSALHDLTGFTRETCKRRLDAAGLVPTHGPHGSALYDTPQALAALYEQPANNQNALAAAKIANLEADTRLKELREARERGELIPAPIVEQVWGGMTGAARAHLLGLPYRLATAAVAVDGMAAVEAVARDLIYQALQHLSEFNPADYLEPGQPQGLGAVT
jgi:hypothetical protein